MEAYMNRFRSLVAGALVAGVLAGGAVFAQGPRGGGQFGGGRGAGGPALALRGLNLTDTQQQQVRESRERHRDEGQKIAERVRAAMDAQRKAVEAVPLNGGVIRATTQALAEAQTDAAIQRATIFNEVWAVLTPDQQAQARKRQAERDARMQQRGERREQRQPQR